MVRSFRARLRYAYGGHCSWQLGFLFGLRMYLGDALLIVTGFLFLFIHIVVDLRRFHKLLLGLRTCSTAHVPGQYQGLE